MPKKDRLNFRVRPELKTLLERAAAIKGITVSEFALSTLGATAEDVIKQHETLVITEKDREVFMSVLSDDSPLPKSWNGELDI